MRRLFSSLSFSPSAGLLLAALLTLLIACSSTPDEQALPDGQPPENRAEVEDSSFRLWKSSESPEGVAPGWMSRTLEATGASPLAEEAESRVEALMVARREACDQALRRLAEQVSALPNPAGGTVGDLLQADKDLRERVERSLRAEAGYTPASTQPVREYRVTAHLPLAPVAATIWNLPVEEKTEASKDKE